MSTEAATLLEHCARAFFDSGAECRIDLIARAWSVLSDVVPLERPRQAMAWAERLLADPLLGPRFGLEPYAVAADICSQPPWAGRGGWSWYTGSAAGLYRAAVGSICGLQLRGDGLRFVPALPSQWPAVHLTLRRPGGTTRFSLCRADALQELAAARALGAQRLAAGEWLLTDATALAACYLVELPAAPCADLAPAPPGCGAGRFDDRMIPCP